MLQQKTAERRMPVTDNDRWVYATIKDIIERTGFGKIELEITVAKGCVATLKEVSRKSHSYHND